MLISQGNLRDAKNLLETSGTLDGDGSAHEIVAEFAIAEKEIILAAQLLDYAASAKFVSSQRRRMIRETAASHILKLLKAVFANDLDRATMYEKISELRIAGRIHAEVGFWYVEKKRWSDAALHFEKGYEMHGCCSACSAECERMTVVCTLTAIVDTVERTFNEIDIEKESEDVENDTNADEASGVLEAHGAVTADIPHGETDDENFDDDETEIVDGGEAEIEGAAQDLVVDASSPDGTRHVAESKSHTTMKSSPDGAADGTGAPNQRTALTPRKKKKKRRGQNHNQWQRQHRREQHQQQQQEDSDPTGR